MAHTHPEFSMFSFFLFLCPNKKSTFIQVKPKHLENMSIDLSSSSCVGTLERKRAAFDLWTIGGESEGDAPIGGEEIKDIVCLLPRKSKKGKLYQGMAILFFFFMSALSTFQLNADSSTQINRKTPGFSSSTRKTISTHPYGNPT